MPAGSDLDRVRTALLADLGSMPSRYSAVWERRPWFDDDERLDVLLLRAADGDIDWLPVGEAPVTEMLAVRLEQLQGEVMERETELWPLCPRHHHELRPVPDGDWIVWVCPTTGERIAAFGD